MKKEKLTDNNIKKILNIDNKLLNRLKEIQEQTINEAKNRKNKNKIKVIGISGSSRDQYDMASENSNSEFLLKKSLEEFEENLIETELIKLRKYNIKPCKACYSTTNMQCHFYCSCYPKGTELSDDMTNILYDKILEADIIIFATPVNNFKMSSLMSLFIDRCISLDGSLSSLDSKATKDKELNTIHTNFINLTANNNIPGSGFYKRFTGKVAGIIVTGHEEGASMVISSLFMTLNHFGMIFPPFSSMCAMSSYINPTHKDKKIVNDNIYIEEAKLLAKNLLTMIKKIKNEKLNWLYDNSLN